MQEKQKLLYDKFSELIKVGFNEKTINKFFSRLNDNDYEILITLFEEGDFPGVNEEDKEKVIEVLYSMEGL